MTGPTFNRVTVTPDMAREWLQRNTSNRDMVPRRVEVFARQMLAGEWKTTHQGIAFSKDGKRLTDGQHRLAAVVAAGVPVEMVVAYGVDDFDVIDTGRPRSASDILRIAGYSNVSDLAASVRMLIPYDTGLSRPWRAGRSATTYTPKDVETYVTKNADTLAVAVASGRLIYQRISGARSAYVAGAFVINRWCATHSVAEVGSDWLHGLATGAGLEVGDPRLALASWLNGAGRLLHSTTRTEVLFMLMVRTFHASAKGQTLAQLVVRNPGDYTYRLPE